MMMSLISRLTKTPTPIAGLALGIASLGWAWEIQTPSGGSIQWTSALIATAICLALVVKFTMRPKVLWTELSHPVVGSVVPTLAMAVMVISASVKTIEADLGIALWLAAVIAHTFFLIAFIWHRVSDLHLTHMVPSWFIPPIGPVVAVLCTPTPELMPVSGALLIFGLGSYAIMLPLMLHRMMFRGEVPMAAKPTIAIMAAPPNLCLAGYLAFAQHPDTILVIVLLGLGILLSAVVYLAFWELLRLPFSPAYAAFTFPTVIAATATFKTASFLDGQGFSTDVVYSLQQWGFIQLTIATAIVSYVAFRYLAYYSAGPKTQSSAPYSPVD